MRKINQSTEVLKPPPSGGDAAAPITSSQLEDMNGALIDILKELKIQTELLKGILQ